MSRHEGIISEDARKTAHPHRIGKADVRAPGALMGFDDQTDEGSCSDQHKTFAAAAGW